MAENPYMLTPEEQLAYAGTDPAHPYIDPRVVTKPVEFALNPQEYGYRNLLEAGVDAAGQVAPYILYNMSPGGVPVTAARNMASDWQNPYMPNWQKVVNSAADLLGVTMMAAPTQIGRMGARAFDYIDDAVKNPYVMSPLRNEVGAVRVGGKVADEPLRPGDTSSPQFKEWFGESKVVDAQGKPLVVYHGTDKQFSSFAKEKIGSKTDAGYFGKGFSFTSDPEYAGVYAGDVGFGRFEKGANIIPAYISIKKPYVVPWSNEGRRITSDPEAFTNGLRSQGYDGIIVQKNPRFGEWYEYVVFEPEQVKSKFNLGEWSRQNQDMLHAVAPVSLYGFEQESTNAE